MDGTTLLQRLSSRTAEPSDAAMAAAAERLDARITAELTPRTRRRTPPARVLRRTGFVGLGVAAATCSAVLVLTAGPTPTASAEVAKTLQAAALAVGADAVLPSTTTTHVLQLVSSSSGRTEDADGGLLIDSSVLVERTTTLRKAAAGDGWERATSASTALHAWGPAKDAMLQQLRDSDSDAFVARSVSDPQFWTGPTSLSPAQVRAMPRDPQALLRTFGGVTSPDSALEPSTNRVIDAAGALLSSGLADAELQAATYRALEQLPDLTVDEHGADIDGRAGVAIGAEVSNGLQRIDLVIDPSTGRFLGRTETNLTATDGAPAGTVEEASAVYPR